MLLFKVSLQYRGMKPSGIVWEGEDQQVEREREKEEKRAEDGRELLRSSVGRELVQSPWPAEFRSPL